MDRMKNSKGELKERVPWIKVMDGILREAGRKGGMKLKGDELISEESVEIATEMWRNIGKKKKKGKNPPVAPQAPPAGKEGGE
ncbi:MAG: hypothetical protein QXP36_08665 [Conexivisphaerales archaeon]